MARLIDADRYSDVLDRYINAPHVRLKSNICEGMRLAIGSCIGFLEIQPTVDAVPVVRCKDCKHWKHADGIGCTDFVKICTLAYYMIGENGYCLYGERKAE